MYEIADQQCQNFATCGEVEREPSGTSFVNLEILKLFQDGQQMILSGQCQYARQFKESIVTLMAVPLIQGTLYAAHARTLAVPDSAEAQQWEAEGAGFVAGILPLVHTCSVEDATVIHDNMKAGNGSKPDFAAVKDALERQYRCLGIQCSNVGGILNHVNGGGGYWEGAAPCTKDSIDQAEKRRKKSRSDRGPTGSGALVVLLAVAGALFMAVVVVVSTFLGPQRVVMTTSDAVMDPVTTPTKIPPALC
jgi:hypothetical protein